jgi:hypothetical protein
MSRFATFIYETLHLATRQRRFCLPPRMRFTYNRTEK